MAQRVEIEGHQFGELLVIRYEGYIDQKSKYLVRCSCGRTAIIPQQDLRLGKTTRCVVCASINNQARFRQMHADRRTGPLARVVKSVGGKLDRLCPTWKDLMAEYRREYYTWDAMIRRCHDPNHKSFAWYGGRGITVSPRWWNFEQFLQDMGRRPLNTTIDRRNSNSGYGTGLCKWSTPIEQANNRRPPQRRSTVSAQPMVRLPRAA